MITVHWSLRSEGVKLLAWWKGEHLFLQWQDNLECQDRLLGSGCGCIGTRWLELFLTCLQWAPLRNNPTAGSLRLCSNFSQQQSTTGTTPGLRRICFGPVRNYLHECCLHTRPCCSSTHGIELVIFKMTLCWQKWWGQPSMTVISLLTCSSIWTVKLLLPKFHQAMKKC